MTNHDAGATAARFTERHPIGTPVRYWPGLRKGEGRASTIRSRAWVMGGGHVVVKVDGYPGGIALTHIEVTTSTDRGRAGRVSAEHHRPAPMPTPTRNSPADRRTDVEATTERKP